MSRSLIRIAVILISFSLCAGCSFTSESIPEANIQFAKARYELGGATSAEECGTYILFMNFGTLFGTDTAYTSGGGGGLAALLGGSAEQNQALYMALQKMEGATHLMKPRVVTTFSGIGTTSLPLFGKRCASVTAQAVTAGGPYGGTN